MQRLLLFAGLVLLSGCTVTYTVNSEQYYRPVSPDAFSYKKRGFRLASSILDTSTVYCFAYPVDSPEYFECYRFFAGGQVLSYSFRGKIDTAAFADVNKGGVGYYHVDGNVIRIQEFTVYAEHFKEGGGGRIEQKYGIIQGDSVLVDPGSISKRYYARKNIFSQGHYNVYKKTGIEVPVLRPDW